MVKPIYRVFVVVVVLFGMLIFATSWWTVFGADPLRDNPHNQRQLLEQARIKRGLIKAADGTVLARSVKRSDGTFTRRYPQDELLSHAIGYSFIRFGQAGIERSRNDPLTGERDSVTSLVDELRGKRQVGDDVITTLDPKAQRVAIDQLAQRKGAVVAMDPKTGAVKVMASYPQYNPNTVPEIFGRLNQDPDAPLLNRTTQGQYPPGSTFKVVTAVAGIDSGKFSPDSVLNGDSPKEISGFPLSNDAGESFGDINLTQALTNSVNTVWAQVAESIGKRTMAKYMERFGFYARPPLDYPAGQRYVSGVFTRRGLTPVTSDLVDVGRVAIGQGGLLATPLQMAMVASAVANKGQLVKPHLTDRIVDPDGRVTDDIGTTKYHRVMSEDTAAKVTAMMAQVVKEGTGTAAALSGIEMAGKTGTAEVDNGATNQVWFIGFAPVDDPKFVVAATVERSDGFGGTVAGPIAKQVMETLLNE